ncbi:YraN family protein [Acetobacter farinalis]|uniref:UPF0102 protein OQ252_03070 n=1 Tax=Acetobacter farinalis TaxID=1260984 RepID=A0ABT3Q527_9PROT|nr:YraN family protein [Acetobacter farinalis]MCX2560389.1 YraN family protein [Acetobacter farinalis]NHO29044.1 hypothetical protein [Acetobacter farinalis]
MAVKPDTFRNVPAPVEFARQIRGANAYRDGLSAEDAASAFCTKEGWSILLKRARTRRGEIDIVMRKGNLICFVEVKKRKTLRDATECLAVCQQKRLFRAAECLLAAHPEWSYEDLRFDLMAVDEQHAIHWVKDVIRQM